MDLSCNYEARIQDIFLIFYKHFEINSSQLMYLLKINASSQFQTLNFQDFLNKLKSIDSNQLKEQNPFLVDIIASLESSEIISV
jgi:hypothetical protein